MQYNNEKRAPQRRINTSNPRAYVAAVLLVVFLSSRLFGLEARV
jgi:hypothetical protein